MDVNTRADQIFAGVGDKNHQKEIGGEEEWEKEIGSLGKGAST